MMPIPRFALATIVGGLLVAGRADAQPVARPTARVEITFSRAARAEPITGRVYLALSRTSSATSTPIQQTDETGVPLFGADVHRQLQEFL